MLPRLDPAGANAPVIGLRSDVSTWQLPAANTPGASLETGPTLPRSPGWDATAGGFLPLVWLPESALTGRSAGEPLGLLGDDVVPVFLSP